MMDNLFFAKQRDFLTLEEVLSNTKSYLEKRADINIKSKILDVASLENGTKNDISFFYSIKYKNILQNTNSGYCILSKENIKLKPDNVIGIINDDPYYAYSLVLKYFYKKDYFCEGISEKSNIDKTAQIGKNVTIKEGVYIGKNVKIGKNSYIGQNSVIMDNCSIGDNSYIYPLVNISNTLLGKNAIIHNGASIGQDGFGFINKNGLNNKILQIGIVRIGDEVEIGANTSIDRGAIGDTVIGNQVKIDNLVQIAHNVVIGEGSIIAGCATVAGSTKIGKFCQIAGRTVLNGHINIGNYVKIAGNSAVGKSIPDGITVSGYPAIPIEKWRRLNVKIHQLLKK